MSAIQAIKYGPNRCSARRLCCCTSPTAVNYKLLCGTIMHPNVVGAAVHVIVYRAQQEIVTYSVESAASLTTTVVGAINQTTLGSRTVQQQYIAVSERDRPYMDIIGTVWKRLLQRDVSFKDRRLAD